MSHKLLHPADRSRYQRLYYQRRRALLNARAKARYRALVTAKYYPDAQPVSSVVAGVATTAISIY